MERRRLLASLGAGLASSLTGCAANRAEQPNTGSGGDVGTLPAVSFDMRSVTDTEIARRVSYRMDVPHKQHEGELAYETVDDGPVMTTATNRPVPEDRPFVYDGSVYEVSYEMVDSAPATTFRVTISEVEGTVGNDEMIEYDDLPGVDKTALEQTPLHDGPYMAGSLQVNYIDDNVPDSVLVPEPDYPIIEWGRGARGRVNIEDSTDRDLNTYEYTARQVHESAEEFGRTVRGDHEFPLADLPEEQEAIVSEAIEDVYRIQWGEPPEAFDRLTGQFSQQTPVKRVYREVAEGSTRSGDYLVRYDGEVYWTDLIIRGESS